MKILKLDDVILFHRKIIKSTGGSDGIRDLSLIESSIYNAFQTFDGKDLYESDLKKIAVTAYSLIKNHGFVDGNKRIGVAVMLLLLRLNDIQINYSQDEIVALGIGTASGELKEEDIEQWIIRHQV